ncbi:hypothetical protein P6Z26_11715 [Enterococcus faecium]|nr:hypothetical protein [Enterococcus faecium]MDT2297932.1 hypothetical protein [Enterococcus faecium]
MGNMETERQIRELEKAMNTTDNRRLYERPLEVIDRLCVRM